MRPALGSHLKGIAPCCAHNFHAFGVKIPAHGFDLTKRAALRLRVWSLTQLAGARSIFPDVHAAGKNGLIFLRRARRKLCEAFFR